MRSSIPKASRRHGTKLLSASLLCLLAGSLAIRAQTTTTKPTNTVSEADRLRGANGPYRANNDLLYYHLDVRVDPATKTIAGKNTVRFKMLTDGTRIQLDLSEILVVEKITLGKEELTYTRDSGAVFIDFPRTLHVGQTYSIDFYYSGAPK